VTTVEELATVAVERVNGIPGQELLLHEPIAPSPMALTVTDRLAPGTLPTVAWKQKVQIPEPKSPKSLPGLPSMFKSKK
jgi:hypothetical protein